MTNKVIKLGFLKTSKIELVDITKAWIVLSLAFAFVLSNINFLNVMGLGIFNKLFSAEFLKILIISFFTAGLGFLLHELAHKFIAQKYGCLAEFRAFDQMLYLALGLAAFIGFIFAAPGAVMIAGQVTRKENGIISLAGPLTNYILAMIFFALALVFPEFSYAFGIGSTINLWLGLFNMIPFGNFDGLKIFHWNTFVWIFMALFGAFFISRLIFYIVLVAAVFYLLFYKRNQF